jgi:1-acyl-sn-glycerol-3-phosphate acyltransferase
MRLLLVALLNGQFYGLMGLLTLAYVPAMVVLGLVIRPFVSRRAFLRGVRLAFSWYGRILVRVLPWPYVRVRYENHETRPVPPPYLGICNHRAASDPVLVSVLPYEGVQVVNIWPMRIPFFGAWARYAGYLSVNEMPVEEFFASAQRLLAEGCSLVVFPEGHRSASRRMGPFHSSAFHLALRARATIVPICIAGNERMPPRGSWFMRPGRVRLRRLPAVRWEQYRHLTPFLLKQHIRDMIRAELLAMEGSVP